MSVALAIPETPGSAATERKSSAATEKPRKRPALASAVPRLKIVIQSSGATGPRWWSSDLHPVYVAKAPWSAGASAIQKPALDASPVAARRRATTTSAGAANRHQRTISHCPRPPMPIHSMTSCRAEPA